MSLVCITNDIPGLVPCTVKGQHAAHCDGVARRWEVDDSLSLRGPAWWPEGTARIRLVEVLTEKGEQCECRGCLPAKADRGLLCWSCAVKAEQAFAIAFDMITHLASVDRAQQLDNAGVRSAEAWKLPVPATWRLADELLVLLGHPEPGIPSTATVWEVDTIVERTIDAIDFDVWISTKAGAEAAIRLTRLMKHAMDAHPMAEYEHPIRNVRCPKCKHRSLLWKPPLAFERVDPENRYGTVIEAGTVEVTCTNCGEAMAHDAYERIAAIEEGVMRRMLGRPDAEPREPKPDEAEPICEACYIVAFPGADKNDRLIKRKATAETCSVCGKPTEDGIYLALPVPVPSPYEALTYMELRELAKQRGLDSRGRGTVIRARLEHDDEARQSNNTEEEAG